MQRGAGERDVCVIFFRFSPTLACKTAVLSKPCKPIRTVWRADKQAEVALSETAYFYKYLLPSLCTEMTDIQHYHGAGEGCSRIKGHNLDSFRTF